MAWSPNARNMTSAAEVPPRPRLNFLYWTLRKYAETICIILYKYYMYMTSPQSQLTTALSLVELTKHLWSKILGWCGCICPGWQHGGRATTTRWTAPLSCPTEKSCWLLTLTSCKKIPHFDLLPTWKIICMKLWDKNFWIHRKSSDNWFHIISIGFHRNNRGNQLIPILPQGAGFAKPKSALE